MFHLTVLLGTFANIPLLELLLEPREITLTSASVCNDVISVVRVFSDDSVINNATFFIQ